jgi:hypothetical protein
MIAGVRKAWGVLVTAGLVVCASVSLGGCGGDDRTVVLVHVVGRPATRSFDTLDITVSNAGGSASQTFTLSGGQKLPLTFSVTPEGRVGELEVQVVARESAGETRGRGSGKVTIVPGTTVDAEVIVEPDDFLVNEEIVRTQWISVNEDQAGRQIGVAPDGTFLISWENDCPLDRCDILARRFDATSTPAQNGTTMNAGDFIVNQQSEYTESPSVAVGKNAYMVAWLFGPDISLVQRDVKATLVGFDGGHPDPIDITVSTDVEDELSPTAIARDDGTFVVVWSRLRPAPGVGHELRARIYDQNGGPLFNEIAVSASAAGDMRMPHGIGLPGGAFVIVWVHDEGGTSNVRARVFGAAGAPVTAMDVPVTSYGTGIVYGPRVTTTTDGFMVAWQVFSSANPDLAKAPLVARRFVGNGSPAAPELVVAAETINIRAQPIMATRPDGAIGVVWQDCNAQGDLPGGASCGIRFRLLHPSGMPAGDSRIVNTTTQGDQLAPSIAAAGDAAFVVAWTDNSGLPPDTDGSGVRARVVYPDLERHDGQLGARCGEPADAPCGDGLSCEATSGGVKLCHETCTTVCKLGGVCVNATYCSFD